MFAPPIAKTKAKTTSTTVSTRAPKTGHQIPARPTGSVAEQVLALERTIGNQATLRLLAQRSSRRSGTGPGDQYEQTGRTVRMPEPQLHIQPGAPSIQPKLVVGEVNDPLEHEADRVADQLTRMPAPQRSITTGPPQLNCKCAACEDEKLPTLQTKPVGSRQAAAGEAPGIVHEVRRSPGAHLILVLAHLWKHVSATGSVAYGCIPIRLQPRRQRRLCDPARAAVDRHGQARAA